MNEFELIAHFFCNQQVSRPDVLLGIGDDCAVMRLPYGQQLLVSMDTLVSGVHFPTATSAYDMGYKSLAVNLSDLAAMGATPAWFSLALTLPTVNETWLSEFSKGLFDLAQQFNVQLIGGDTTRGPLSITIQIHGFSPVGKYIMRQGAQPGDLIYVTNSLGDAGLALLHVQGKEQVQAKVLDSILPKLNRPMPRIAEGLLLRSYATAMIDLSDGLIADLHHILQQSGVGALLDADKIPLSNELKNSLAPDKALNLAFAAGDDYELCFTIPPQKQAALEQLMLEKNYFWHCIGIISNEKKLVIQQGVHLFDHKELQGYSHF